MVELFRWQEQKCELNLSISGIEPFIEIEKLEKEEAEPKQILSERYGTKENNITIVHGAQEGLFFTLLALKPREVYIALPAYQPMFEQSKELGIKTHFINNPYDLKNKVIILSNPNNPTGEIYNVQELVENKNFLILDEIFKYFINEKDKLIENTIIISSTSKFFNFKNRKVGWIICEERIIEKIKYYKDLISPEPIFDEELINYAYKNFNFFKERNINIVNKNLEIINKYNLSEFKIKYNKFMPVMMLERENFDSMDYCLKLLKEKGVLLTPMSYFLKRNAIRMYLGYEDSRKIEEAIKRMVEFNNLYFKTK
jgi:aspartate/methionine/tyrosine aminotransferase